MFFTGITVLFGLFLLVFTLVVFFSKPKPVPEKLVFNRPKIDINLQVLESDMIKMFEPALQMDLQFEYEAVTKKRVKRSGMITAVSEEEAYKILEGMELVGIKIEKAEAGRENPFAPY